MPTNAALARLQGLTAPLIWMLVLLPAVRLVWLLDQEALGANPIEALTHATGDWALRLLLAALAITPLQRLTGFAWLHRTRRPLGLSAFAYACAHWLIYLWLDRFFDWNDIAHDLLRRPFIALGFASFLLLLPLAATSFDAAIRWLGPQRWRALHHGAYAAATLGVLHYAWLVKRDLREPLLYALVLVLLIGARLVLPAKRQ